MSHSNHRVKPSLQGTRRALTVLAGVLAGLVCGCPAGASGDDGKTTPYGPELRRAQATLFEVQEQVLSLSDPLDRARLRRAHADWVRFRGTSCEAETVGTPCLEGCLLRETEKRTVDLLLLLAQRRPVDLRTWRGPVPIPERQALLQKIEARHPRYATLAMPDEFLRMGENQYLLAYGAAGSRGNRLEFVNLRTDEEWRLLDGPCRIREVLKDKRETRYALVEQDEVAGNVRTRTFHLFHLARNSSGIQPRGGPLAAFSEDARGGLCAPHAETLLRLERAQHIERILQRDHNGDGTPDLVFEVVEVDCRSRKEEKTERVFLADETGFVRE